MLVRFWGTRGSIPTAPSADYVRGKVFGALMAARGKELRSAQQIREFMESDLPFGASSSYGGNTPCVQVDDVGSKEYLLLDGGSGLRVFGEELMGEGRGAGAIFHIFLSHLHYDHIQGIPFFVPAYLPGNKVVIHGCHDTIEQALRDHMKTPFFPVPFETMAAEITFETHAPGDVLEVAGCRVTTFRQNHPGVSYGYRLEDSAGKVAVYSSDAEHNMPAHGKAYPFIDFIHKANLLIFDAPYTHGQTLGPREHWGHSSNIMGVELAARAEVGHLVLFHHDPASTDEDLDEFHHHTEKFLVRSRDVIRTQAPGQAGSPDDRDYPKRISLSYDGLVLDI